MRYEMLAKENIGFGKIEDARDQSACRERRQEEPGE